MNRRKAFQKERAIAKEKLLKEALTNIKAVRSREGSSEVNKALGEVSDNLQFAINILKKRKSYKSVFPKAAARFNVSL